MPAAVSHPALNAAPDVIREVILQKRPGTAGAPAGGDARIRAWRFRQNHSAPDEIDVDRLAAAIADGSDPIWIDLSAYHDDDLRRLGETLDLNPAGIRSALAPWRRPGLAALENHALAGV